MNQNALKELSAAIGHWRAPVIGGDIPHGDMPGDKVQIGPDHIAKANTIFPLLVPMAAQMAVNGRVVITVCGGSGVLSSAQPARTSADRRTARDTRPGYLCKAVPPKCYIATIIARM